MSLLQFVTDNRLALIKRTSAMAANRASTPTPDVEGERNGVPIFLSQLVAALEDDAERNPSRRASNSVPPQNSDIARSAVLHGQGMRKLGFTIEEVVREYGDVCQAVTELADERDAGITATEFHTLNRCLDEATARSVASWTVERDQSHSDLRGKLDLELSNLVLTATYAFEVFRSGRVGIGGSTATVLARCLAEMRALLDDAKPAAD